MVGFVFPPFRQAYTYFCLLVLPTNLVPSTTVGILGLVIDGYTATTLRAVMGWERI